MSTRIRGYVKPIAYFTTLQNMAGDRISGTEYKNTTGKPFIVTIRSYSASLIHYAKGYVKTTSGIAGSDIIVQHKNDAGKYLSISFIVPPEHYYMVISTTLDTWFEVV